MISFTVLKYKISNNLKHPAVENSCDFTAHCVSHKRVLLSYLKDKREDNSQKK